MIPRRHHRLPIISLLLLALVARALVPAGFMPSTDGSSALTLCPDGMVMPSGSGGFAHTDHCPFGAAPFAAPINHFAPPPVLATALGTVGFESASWVPSARTARANQPRAPPA
jgi:hypothetical protein